MTRPPAGLFLRPAPADPGLAHLRTALGRALATIAGARFASLFLDAPAAIAAPAAAALRAQLDAGDWLMPGAEVTWHGPSASPAALTALGVTRRSLPGPQAVRRMRPAMTLAIELGPADLPHPPGHAWMRRMLAAGMVHLGLSGSEVPASWVVVLDRLLRAHGFCRYETLHWALPGHEARWLLDARRGHAIMALGPGAYGRWPDAAGWRWWRSSGAAAWCRAVGRGGDGRGRLYRLTPQERAQERVIDGLRLAEGITPAAIEAETGLVRSAWLDEHALARLRASGRLHDLAGRLLAADPGEADALALALLR
ncbi:MAG TPA: hypothetical protein VNS22_08120 [Geminicoccus sp.]|uniref:hypothetical protein n=1 Tax=Geminicoccus sp. TaxID=2024832 RepID=UPI002B523A35|nr:hypothetical protein [Geminicoccus sp.]HWL68338.1 hypothetical protein [Geminicoccus sp.]